MIDMRQQVAFMGRIVAFRTMDCMNDTKVW